MSDHSLKVSALLTDCQVRLLAAVELPLLEQHFGRGVPPKHRDRLAAQESGVIAYLIAWDMEIPVGHLMLRWAGPEDEPMASELPDCPEIQDLFVVPERRCRGIGATLLAVAEDLAKQHGYEQIGLSVGLAPDYDVARRLYQQRSYQHTEFGVYSIRWPYRDQDGQERWWEEAAIYLVKQLS